MAAFLVMIYIATGLTVWSAVVQKQVTWWTVSFDVALAAMLALAWRYLTLANDGRAIMFVAMYALVAMIIPVSLRFVVALYFAKTTIRRAMLSFAIILALGITANGVFIERAELGEKGAGWAQQSYPAWRRIGF